MERLKDQRNQIQEEINKTRKTLDGKAKVLNKKMSLFEIEFNQENLSYRGFNASHFFDQEHIPKMVKELELIKNFMENS